MLVSIVGYKRLVLLVSFQILLSLSTIVSSLVLIPLVQALTDSNYVINYLGIQFTLKEYSGIVLITLVALALVKFLVMKLSQLYIEYSAVQLTSGLINGLFNMPFKYKHDSKILADYERRASLILSLFQAYSVVFVNLFIATSFFIVLLVQSDRSFLTLQTILIITFLVIRIWSRKVMKSNGKILDDVSNRFSLLIMEMVKSKLQIILEKREIEFRENILSILKIKSKINTANFMFGNFSKHLFELFGTLIILAPVLLNSSLDQSDMLYQISILLIAYQRILPAIQGVNQNLGVVNTIRPQMEDIFCDFVPDLQIKKFVEFDGTLKLEKVTAKNGEILITYPEIIELNNGRLNIIVGPSGSGKSTLLRLIFGFQKLQSGTRRNSQRALKSFELLQGVSYISQDFYLKNFDSVAEFLEVDFERIERDNRMKRLMGQDFDFRQSIMNNGENLSGGQRKRLMLAKEMYKLDKKLVIFDEITSGLDENAARYVYEMLYEMSRRVCVVVITHDHFYPKDSNIIRLK